MSRIIEAVFEDGVLRPTEPLELTEGSSVRIAIVEAAAIDTQWDAAAALRAADEIASLPIEGANDNAPVGREHDRYLYGDLSEFGREKDK